MEIQKELQGGRNKMKEKRNKNILISGVYVVGIGLTTLALSLDCKINPLIKGIDFNADGIEDFIEASPSMHITEKETYNLVFIDGKYVHLKKGKEYTRNWNRKDITNTYIFNPKDYEFEVGDFDKDGKLDIKALHKDKSYKTFRDISNKL